MKAGPQGGEKSYLFQRRVFRPLGLVLAATTAP